MADSPFVEDPGPGFDAEQAAAGAEQVRHEAEAEARAAGAEAFGIPEVEEEQVCSVLLNVGDGLHAAFGVGELDWQMTQRDLERIGPPLTRIINRYEAAKLIAGHSDELAVTVGFGLWGWRSVLERVAVLRELERTGQAPPSTPPPSAAAPPAPPPPPPPPAAAPQPPPPSPAPGAMRSPPGDGGDQFPGAGAPRDLPPVAPGQLEIAPGYVTTAQRIRQARERRPDAVPYQTQAGSQ